MGIKGVDIQKIMEENKKKVKTGSNQPSDNTGGILSMANNPMVQMAIKNIPKKYKVMIMLAFIFVIIGIAATVYGLIHAIQFCPMILLKSLAGIIGFSFFVNTVYKVTKNQAKALRIILTVIADSAILYWIIFF